MSVSSDLVEKFRSFFNDAYMDQIKTVLLSYPKVRSVIVDFQDLEKYDPVLADEVHKNPDVAIPSAEEAISSMNLVSPLPGKAFTPHVRFFNAPGSETTMIESLGSEQLGKLISFKGVIIKRTDIFHKTKTAFFRCTACDATYRLNVGRNFRPPKKCDSCGRNTLIQDEEASVYVDAQIAEMQDLLERVSGGSPASKIELWVEDDLVNTFNPGENVEITGILRIKPARKYSKNQEYTFPRFVEVVYIRSLKRDFEEIDITKEDEEKILELAADPNVSEKIFKSIAPAIYGYEEVKMALALQLFGGTKGKILRGNTPARDDIHILLIGDPGIAKTRFLQSVTSIAPKSIYVSGKSVSGVGLTASAEKDDLSGGGWTLKAGALVLASGGIGAIDEFDKIDDSDRASLHEVMESQTVSIAKAGIHARFRAKTAIVAAANPKYGRFNQNRPPAEQFNIPPSLLSRFDLIFPIYDVLDEVRDEKLARHILKMHKEAMDSKVKQNVEEVIDKEFLRKYIAYARRNIRPALSDAATEKIINFYTELRKVGYSDSGTASVPITPRYLEGLVRLAEAHAKLRLSNTVEEQDAEVSIRLFKFYMDQLMTDKETGRIDVDIIHTGKPRSQVRKIETVYNIIKSKTKDSEAVERQEIIEEAEAQGIDESTTRKAISELLRKGDIYEKSPGWFAPSVSE